MTVVEDQESSPPSVGAAEVSSWAEGEAAGSDSLLEGGDAMGSGSASEAGEATSGDSSLEEGDATRSDSASEDGEATRGDSASEGRLSDGLSTVGGPSVAANEVCPIGGPLYGAPGCSMTLAFSIYPVHRLRDLVMIQSQAVDEGAKAAAVEERASYCRSPRRSSRSSSCSPYRRRDAW